MHLSLSSGTELVVLGVCLVDGSTSREAVVANQSRYYLYSWFCPFIIRQRFGESCFFQQRSGLDNQFLERMAKLCYRVVEHPARDVDVLSLNSDNTSWMNLQEESRLPAELEGADDCLVYI